ncbi:hypothetical protein [Vibrio sp. VPAP30]|uniref:hypothetical protein n=1 Tax=Vibrio sp. VPAP30 TaxID=1647102 RepID=UPI00065A07E6|nr:hypothetical protein [Vibrio sp. VPAP30]KLN62835.1 ATPase [Vibrio sp. VPAP30]
MKKQVFYGCALAAVLTSAVTTWSYADNPAFPPVDERQAEAEAQAPRFFVKYHKGAEQQTRELLQSYQLEVVDTLDSQHVLVVSGSQDQVDKLTSSKFIDYVEPEPIRSLYSQ